ncbi:E22 family MetX-like putative esterase [Neptunicella sp.]|uniref:E22 family MetX-like putative esterase n=1 Tax=Neptunicella sp. TaxID=2125986 RepID=UPI003F694872
MRHYIILLGKLALILCCSVQLSWAQETLLVQKQSFEMENFSTFGGKTIKQVKVGWESYGTLNQDKSNVILVTHYFSGNSHAAGKYSQDDAKPGYWDSIIGPGKTIDTNRYFVISVDSLVNLGVHDPHVITTGPASIDPDTGNPYGLTFPVVTIRDFVNVQKAVLTSLGISKLHAVIGASMGSMQALEWATAYPDWVERMISVIGVGQADAWTTLTLEQWATPIRLDQHWNNGNYYQQQAPLDGLTASLMMITQQAMHPDYINALNPQHWPLEPAPLNDINQSHQVVNWLKGAAQARAKIMDANHLLYLVRANQLFVAGHHDKLQQAMKRVKAKCLLLPSDNDLLLMPYMAKELQQALIAAGKSAKLAEISGPMGHLNGVTGISQQRATIAAFLADKD